MRVLIHAFQEKTRISLFMFPQNAGLIDKYNQQIFHFKTILLFSLSKSGIYKIQSRKKDRRQIPPLLRTGRAHNK